MYSERRMSQVEEEYFNYRQLCEFLGISYGTARNWKLQGKLTYTKFRNRVYFPKKAILKDLKINTIKAVDAMMEEFRERECS